MELWVWVTKLQPGQLLDLSLVIRIISSLKFQGNQGGYRTGKRANPTISLEGVDNNWWAP